MNKISGYGSINFLQGDVGQIEQTLPIELIKNILFFGDDRTLQSAVTVCRRWSLASVDAATDKRFGPLKSFAKLVGRNLNKETYDSNLFEKLKAMEQDTTLFSSKNLVKVKSSFLALKEKFINILKDLKKGDLELFGMLTRIQNESIPNELCSLAILYQKVDEAIGLAKELPETYQMMIIGEICKPVIMAGKINKAIEIVTTFYKNEFCEKVVFSSICMDLTKSGEIAQAIEFAKAIPGEKSIEVLKKISETMEEMLSKAD